MVTESAADAKLMLPAASVAFAVMAWVPAAEVVAVMLQLPGGRRWPVPICVVPSNSVDGAAGLGACR